MSDALLILGLMKRNKESNMEKKHFQCKNVIKMLEQNDLNSVAET